MNVDLSQTSPNTISVVSSTFSVLEYSFPPGFPLEMFFSNDSILKDDVRYVLAKRFKGKDEK